jgi:hypothetical protein
MAATPLYRNTAELYFKKDGGEQKRRKRKRASVEKAR